MPPECMELWARRFKIKRGQRLALFLEDAWMIALQLPIFPKGGSLVEFWMGRNSAHSRGSGWPGRGWQVYSLGVSEGMGSEVAILPKLCSFCILCRFSL